MFFFSLTFKDKCFKFLSSGIRNGTLRAVNVPIHKLNCPVPLVISDPNEATKLKKLPQSGHLIGKKYSLCVRSLCMYWSIAEKINEIFPCWFTFIVIWLFPHNVSKWVHL